MAYVLDRLGDLSERTVDVHRHSDPAGDLPLGTKVNRCWVARFARDLVVQELGIALLAKRNVRLLTATGDDLTDSDDLGRKMMRHVAGAFMEYEKGRLVAKLRGARARKRKETGKKVGGRKSHAELWPEVVAEARHLRRSKGKAGRLSYREISARLKDAGYVNERGESFNLQSVRAMIEGPQPRQRRARDIQ